jgi:hypothetical protein
MDTNLKIYTCELGWMGSIVVVAKTKEDARKLMENYENYRCNIVNGNYPEVEEFALADGFVHCDMGDT